MVTVQTFTILQCRLRLFSGILFFIAENFNKTAHHTPH